MPTTGKAGLEFYAPLLTVPEYPFVTCQLSPIYLGPFSRTGVARSSSGVSRQCCCGEVVDRVGPKDKKQNGLDQEVRCVGVAGCLRGFDCCDVDEWKGFTHLECYVSTEVCYLVVYVLEECGGRPTAVFLNRCVREAVELHRHCSTSS